MIYIRKILLLIFEKSSVSVDLVLFIIYLNLKHINNCRHNLNVDIIKIK